MALAAWRGLGTMTFDMSGGTLLVAGAGKMGMALIEGLLTSGMKPEHLLVQDPSPTSENAARLAALGVKVVAEAGPVLSGHADLLLLAVKPQAMADVLPGLSSCCGPETLVISVAAGTTLQQLQAGLQRSGSVMELSIIRAMPNTPAAIGSGITACVANNHVNQSGRKTADEILATVGDVAWLEDEGLMDAVTAVSGSGPAYVFLLVEALAEAGEAAGLSADLSLQLARKTVAGSGELLAASQVGASELRKAVTSPGGTTAAALQVLMADDGLPSVLKRAVLAARDRGRELG
jgi:pyrroline-5-carboxylate reductase